MPKRTKKTPPSAPPMHSPWMLCIWRGEVERCHYACVRLEQVVGPDRLEVRAVEALFVQWSGMVAHRRYRPDMLHLAEPTGVRTTVGQMLDYFTRRLMLVGGDAQAYDALGLQRPVLVQQETAGDPAKERDLAELYTRAADLLGTTEEVLQGRYSHLNRGLQAMNLRNRLRAKGHNV